MRGCGLLLVLFCQNLYGLIFGTAKGECLYYYQRVLSIHDVRLDDAQCFESVVVKTYLFQE